MTGRHLGGMIRRMDDSNRVAALARRLAGRSDDDGFSRDLLEAFVYIDAGEDVIALENLADIAHEWAIPLTSAELGLFSDAIDHYELDAGEPRWLALSELLER